jgi:hypothetical protein
LARSSPRAADGSLREPGWRRRCGGRGGVEVILRVRTVLSLRYVDGLAFSGRPRGPARIRVAPPAHGAAAGGRAPGPRPAPLRSAAGPGPGSTIGGSARGRSRTESALRSGCRAQPGPVCNVTRPTHCAARARPPGGPLRRRRRMGSTIVSSAGPLSDRGRSTSRQPGPGWARTALSRDSRLRGARGPRRARCVAAGGRGSRDGRRARGGRRLRSSSESLRLGLV